MILRLTTCHENALSPLGEGVARDGTFTGRRGSGEGSGFAVFMEAKNLHFVAALPGRGEDSQLVSDPRAMM
jgi:hypothetical protein